MHNRKKPDAPPSESEVKALAEKTFMYKSLVDVVLQRKQAKDKSPETLILVGKLLKLNPDFYSLWNMRREILLEIYPEIATANPDNKLDNPSIRDVELQISADGIRRNPKSYGAWHHRLWVADRFVMDFESELQLCKDFLRADQRNFHCWNYRRAIHQRSSISPISEFDYSTEKIQENFSNYSAFHHRSCFLKNSSMDIETLIEHECSVVENAIFTEPDDQSAWWYQQFLFTWLFARYKELGINLETYIRSLEHHIGIVQSLLEIEPSSRWAMNSLVFLIDMYRKVKDATPDGVFSFDLEDLNLLRKSNLLQLCAIDPYHKNRYHYMLRQHA